MHLVLLRLIMMRVYMPRARKTLTCWINMRLIKSTMQFVWIIHPSHTLYNSYILIINGAYRFKHGAVTFKKFQIFLILQSVSFWWKQYDTYVFRCIIWQCPSYVVSRTMCEELYWQFYSENILTYIVSCHSYTNSRHGCFTGTDTIARYMYLGAYKVIVNGLGEINV